MGHRLLLCINDPDTTQLLTRALTREGYEVDIHTDLGAANCTPSTEPDIVVLDESADPAGGPSALWRIRDAGTSTPVLLLTNRTASIDHVVAQDSGATNCLAKPFRFAELLACLHALLPKEPAPFNTRGRAAKTAQTTNKNRNPTSGNLDIAMAVLPPTVPAHTSNRAAVRNHA